MGWPRWTFQALRGLAIVAMVGLAGSAGSTMLGAHWSFSSGAEPSSVQEDDLEDGEDADEEAESGVAGSGGGGRGRDKEALADAVVEGNLFCPTCAPAGVGPEPPPGVDASRLPLELLVTMEASDPRLSLATIRDTELETLGAYGIDDVVRLGVSVYEIGRGRVVLRNGASLETIEAGAVVPAAPTPAAKTPPPKTPNPNGIEGAEDAIRCTGDHCSVDRSFVDGLLANPGALTRQARVVPSAGGFKFYGIRPGSLPKLLGLQNGDMLTSVNGTELSSIDQAMGLYSKLRSASHLSVTIDRKGKTVQKDIQIE